MEFNFFGRKTLVALSLMLLIAFISNVVSLPQDLVWKIIVEIESQMPNSALKQELNKKIISTPELLEYKVKREVDRAITEYKAQEAPPIPSSEYYELPPDGSKAQELLGGTMGIRLTKP
jgi:hypothetical protein